MPGKETVEAEEGVGGGGAGVREVIPAFHQMHHQSSSACITINLSEDEQQTAQSGSKDLHIWTDSSLLPYVPIDRSSHQKKTKRQYCAVKRRV